MTLGGSRPAYLQVADELRTEITSGRLKPGERLPSVRDLSVRFEIAAVTVQSALRVLREEGLIVSRSTRGYFVRDELPEPPAPSPEYALIRDQLRVVQATVEQLADRISRLEDAVLPPAADGPHEQQSPASEPDETGPPAAS
jgi:GntR family transcriptional regulator